MVCCGVVNVEKIEFALHGIAGAVAAAIILAPMARNYLHVGVSIYAVLFVLLLCLTIFDRKILRLQFPQIILCFLLSGFLIFMGTYPLLADFNRENFISTALSFGFGISVAVLSCFSWRRSFYSCFFSLIVFVSLIVSLLVFYGFIAGSGDFRKIYDVGYLSSGIVISLGCCCLVVCFLFSRNRLIPYLLFALVFLGLVTCLSRAALLFSGIIVLLFLLFYWPDNKIKKSIDIFQRLLLAGSCFLTVIFFLPGRTANRLLRLFYGNEFSPVKIDRMDLWSGAFELISDSPVIGHGFGYDASDVISHNMFLQVGVDGGTPAMIFLFLLIVFPLIVFIVSWRSGLVTWQPLAWSFLAAYLFLVMRSCVSGDFYKARSLYVFASVLIGLISMEARCKMKPDNLGR